MKRETVIDATDITPVGRRVYGATEPGEGERCRRTTPLVAAERQEVVELIARAREGRESIVLPERLRTRDWESVTRVLLDLDARRGLVPVGWKIGAASAEVRAAEGLPEPSPGRIYDGTVFPSGATLSDDLFINYRNNECEFAFVLGSTLEPRSEGYDRAEVADAVATMELVLEVGDTVFEDWYGAAGYLGSSLDNGGGAALIRSAPIHDWRKHDLASVRIDLHLNDTRIKSGVGSAAMGDPLTSLTWLVNWVGARGITLTEGEIVSTGTCTGHCFAVRGDTIRATFSGLGEVTVSYA